ncbi:DNA-binding protein [Anoxybacillus gonensis]|uniref:DNA-binding protein n=1 Tax=Anoxybacillus gonensis TaxID=198467 RepID=UPI003D7696C1
MGVIRIQKNSNYVVMSKVGLHDDRLSWKAKGLLAYMLSMPNDWTFYNDELMKHSPDGSSTFKAAMNELKEYGYVVRRKMKDKKGKFIGWETVVYEQPIEDECRKVENRPSENRPSENRPSENRPSKNDPLLNNKELNNNLLSNKEINDDDIGNDHTQSFQLIANRYIQRRGKGLSLSPKDETAIEKLLQEQIPLDDILKLIDQVFDEYEPKFNGDEIHSFEYVRKVLLSKYHEQKEGEGTDGGTIHKHRRGVGRPAKEGKSYEQALRELEAARRAWGG